MIILFAFNTHERAELPAEIRVAANPSDANAIIAEMDKAYPRIGRLDWPVLRTVKLFAPVESEKPKSKAKAK